MVGLEVNALTQDRKLQVLVIMTRYPHGQMSGRIMVLQTLLRSLSALGHGVTVAYFDRPGAPRPPTDSTNPTYPTDHNNGTVAYHAMPHAGQFERAISVACAFLWGHISMNEALYSSRRARQTIAQLVAAQAFDLVVTDMIRTASYGKDSGLAWIADLDDLLSERYAQMAADDAGLPISFGYLNAPILSRLAAGFQWLGRWVLRREAKVLSLRERLIARQAHLVTLVSSTEAAALSQASGKQVVATPMSIPAPQAPCTRNERPAELVFLGGLDYAGNFNALRDFDTRVRPGLLALGLADLTLDVIGTALPLQRKNFSSAIRFLGYVAPLYSVLQDYRFMLVPQVTPGGIKTKIVVAARAGTVVLAHVTATQGMALTDGKDVLVWNSTEDLAALITALRARDIDAAMIARNAQVWAETFFGETRLKHLWHRNIDLCLGAADASCSPTPRAGYPLLRTEDDVSSKGFKGVRWR